MVAGGLTGTGWRAGPAVGEVLAAAGAVAGEITGVTRAGAELPAATLTEVPPLTVPPIETTRVDRIGVFPG